MYWRREGVLSQTFPEEPLTDCSKEECLWFVSGPFSWAAQGGRPHLHLPLGGSLTSPEAQIPFWVFEAEGGDKVGCHASGWPRNPAGHKRLFWVSSGLSRQEPPSRYLEALNEPQLLPVFWPQPGEAFGKVTCLSDSLLPELLLFRAVQRWRLEAQRSCRSGLGLPELRP